MNAPVPEPSNDEIEPELLRPALRPVRRARVEAMEMTKDENPHQNIVLVWDEVNGPTRRETVRWSGMLTVMPEQKTVFEQGQPVSVLVDGTRPDRFVVYRFGFYQAL